MFKNYFKTAFRNLKRNKSYALINTLGLTVGIASCLLLFLVIRFESSFDNFHPKKNRIYRVCTEFHNEEGVSYHDGVSFPVTHGIRIDFPQIREVAAIFNRGAQVTINNGECLGLYGLVSFMAVQRTEEIGIRKVLGASVRTIIYLLSKEFTLLIILAFMISAPIAWYLMHEWLKNYAYQIPLSASIFLLAIGSSILIAWLTVAHRAINAALANPITSLRSE
jgi:hypothetical protein